MATFKWKSKLQSLLYFSLCTTTLPLTGTNYNVTNTNDSGAGSLRAAINSVNAGALGDTITFTAGGTITLASPLPAITQTNVTMFTNGNAVVMAGSSLYPGLCVWPTGGSFTINNTTGGSGSFATTNTAAIGGTGGSLAGGGLGAGGGIFVGPTANVLIEGISFTNCKAEGGPGGGTNGGRGGGGGGMALGHGGNVGGGTAGGGGGGGYAGAGGGGGGDGGGGGGGMNFNGGDTSAASVEGGGGGSTGGAGGASGGVVGGNGASGIQPGSPGGAGGMVGHADGFGGVNWGAGGGGIATSGSGGPGGIFLGGTGGQGPGVAGGSGGGGGGIGGGGGGTGGNGGNGGFSGGGGGAGVVGATALAPNGGNGGYGGGGGGGTGGSGGNGGFGGGGGSFSTIGPGHFPGSGGYGGGSGSSQANDGGGGGAGLGGAIYIGQSATLRITHSVSFSGSNALGGAAGGTFAGSGFGQGKDIFIEQTGTMDFGHTGSVTLSNPIQSDASVGGSAGGLIMSGSGTLNLTTSNSYFGTTKFNAGVVAVSADNRLGLAANPLLFNGGALELTIPSGFTTSRATTVGPSGGIILTDPGVTATFNSTIAGPGTLTKGGTGILILTGTNAYNGLNCDQGTVQISQPSNLGLSTGQLEFSNSAILELLTGFTPTTIANPVKLSGAGAGSGGTVQVDPGVTATFSGNITNTGELTKQGTGTMVLTGAATTYSGLTTINVGTLAAGATNALSPNSIVSLANPVSGAFLNITGFDNTIAGLAGGGVLSGNVILGANTLTLGNNTTGSFYGGAISGTGGITKQGTATQVFLGTSNTYSGLTTINAGTLAVGAINTLSPNSIVSFANTAGAKLDITGFDNTVAGLENGGATGGNVFLGANTLTLGNNTTATSYAGAISGTGGITKQGTAKQTLTGTSNTYSGLTTINAGTFAGGATNALSPNSIVNLANTAGALLDITGFNNTIAGLEGGGTTGGNVTLGADTLTLGNNITATSYAGAITGVGGGITKQGAATQTLTGTSNTYSGLTSITKGTFAAGAINALSPNSIVNLTNTLGAVLYISGFDNTVAGLEGGGPAGGDVTLGANTLTLGNNTTATSYAGKISGVGGAVLKQGTATQTLTGLLNDYSGLTTINAGTLAAGAVNALSANSQVELADVAGAVLDITGFNNTIAGLDGGGSTGGNVTLGANTLTFGGNNAPTIYGGSISGVGGGITKVGTGTSFFSGTNTYSGLTTISAGTLEIDAFSALPSPGGGVTDNGTLTFNAPGTATYAGNITGTGVLNHNNAAGTLSLTGTNSVGPLNVNAGKLAINGSTTSTLATVALGATISGNGTLTGPLTCNGTISPGNSIGVLNVVGNVVQASASTYLVEVSPNNGVADLLNITGTYTIQPNATLALFPSPGSYPTSNVYQIVATTGGVFGTFDNVPNNLPTVGFGVFYRNNGVFLEVLVTDFSTIGCGGNANSVATYLDTLTPTPGTDLAFIFSVLRALDFPAICNAFDQLHPAPYKDLILAQQKSVFSISKGIGYRLNELLDTRCRTSTERKQFAIWSNVYGEWSEQGNKHHHLGYDSKGGGAMLGADYCFTDHFVLGLTGAYSYNDVDVNKSRAHANINSYYGALYAMFHGDHTYLDMAVIGGFDQFDASRKIRFADAAGIVHRRAHTDHNGWDVDGHLGLGLMIGTIDKGFITPFASFDYLFLHEDGFKESGAKSLNLKVGSTDDNMLRSEAGINLAKCFKTKHGKWTPQMRFSAVRENRFADNHYRSHFVGQPGSFSVTGLYPNRTLFSPGAGITGMFYDDKMSLSLDYDGEFGDGYNDQIARAEFSWGF